MIILILILPLLGSISALFFGRWLGIGAGYFATLNIFISFLIATFFFYKIIYLGINYKLVLVPWISIDIIQINWSFLFDSLTITMLIVVTSISTLVHLYSLEYMASDPHLIRFMSYLSLFTFFMLILVTANNLLQMFVGWEGVGLCSYLLINFWFTRIQANKAAIKAMLINRIGDFAILIALFLIFYTFNSFDYDIIFSLLFLYNKTIIFLNFTYVDIIAIFLFLGAMGKSAQIGLHTWLPDAMEGPTPVSALIHAATMVTAGVFLVVRCSFIFEFSQIALNFILVIGACTCFFASSSGLFQNDIKKIIAYSTCSQLGYMIFSCGLSSYDVAMFHLSNHAFFKALLFLTAGAIIHAVKDEQDIRKFGGLASQLPILYTVMLIGSLALAGFPFLAGFYSKDIILELAYSKQTILSFFVYYLGSFSVFFTAFYSTRLFVLVFLSKPNGSRESLFLAHEPGFKMTVPLLILCCFSIIVGYLTSDLFIGFGTPFWRNSIFILPNAYGLVDIEFIPLYIKLFPLVLAALGTFFAYYIYMNKLVVLYNYKQNSKLFRQIYHFLNRRWYFDKVYNQFIGQNIINSGYHLFYKELDRGLLEQFGPRGIIVAIRDIRIAWHGYQYGSLHFFLILLLSYFLFLLFYLILFNNYYGIIDVILVLLLVFLTKITTNEKKKIY